MNHTKGLVHTRNFNVQSAKSHALLQHDMCVGPFLVSFHSNEHATSHGDPIWMGRKHTKYFK